MTSDADRSLSAGESVSTPYLDRRLPLPDSNPGYRRIRPWQTALILLAFAFVMPLVIYLLFLSVIFVHEVGHCLAALLVGMEFDGIRVGPIELDRHYKVGWCWNWNTFATGYAKSLPQNESFLPVRLTAGVIAGPLSNIMGGLVILRLYPDGDSLLFGLGQLFAIASLIIGFVNLIPLHYAGTPSDGMRLLMLLSSKRRKRWIVLLNRAAALKRSETPETEPAMILSSIGDFTSDHVEANWVAYTSATANRNYELAGSYLEECLAKCSIATPDLREEFILAAARFQAVGRKRPDVAREWLNSGNPSKARVNRASTEALVLVSEGKIDLALAKVDQGERLVAQLPNSPQRARQEVAWSELRALLLKMQASK